MTLDEMVDEWEKDCKIDWTEPDKESLKVSELHHKYLKMLTNARVSLRKYIAQRKELNKHKWAYFQGDLNGDPLLEKLGWEPYLGKKVLKVDMERHINADSDVQKVDYKVSYLEEKIVFLEGVLKSIYARGFQIRDFITWQQFTNGTR